ncbi:MAG: histidine phosphatase family protein [Hyphomicrobiales bacterium]|nr:histidine phosphatase family protein [Hyphomicrobiales bacterium]MBV8425736.1 histidine phosphatase family protein [Hyphomicrobiales bacterium]MBV9431849.1 histidine phosphatase family protein [Hyphomicrobiales bacterium]MBV9741478.1 histidine phosphatase family protein [Hyphomicrobiales bacterium]
MKRLLLLRHAKSDRPTGVGDHERPLASRGREDARRMGAYMQGEMLLPSLALVSTAVRTRQTWDLLVQGLGRVPELRFDRRIYDAPASRLANVIAETPDELGEILLIGHNPGLADLAHRLVGHGDRYALARMRTKFPTAALAVLDLAGEVWRELADGSARLDRFVTPKGLRGEGGA